MFYLFFFSNFFQSAAKFEIGRAQQCLDWIEAVVERNIEYPEGDGVRDQNEFGAVLKNGHLLCELVTYLLTPILIHFTTSSKTMNPNLHNFFDLLEQVFFV